MKCRCGSAIAVQWLWQQPAYSFLKAKEANIVKCGCKNRVSTRITHMYRLQNAHTHTHIRYASPSLHINTIARLVHTFVPFCFCCAAGAAAAVAYTLVLFYTAQFIGDLPVLRFCSWSVRCELNKMQLHFREFTYKMLIRLY